MSTEMSWKFSGVLESIWWKIFHQTLAGEQVYTVPEIYFEPRIVVRILCSQECVVKSAIYVFFGILYRYFWLSIFTHKCPHVFKIGCSLNLIYFNDYIELPKQLLLTNIVITIDLGYRLSSSTTHRVNNINVKAYVLYDITISMEEATLEVRLP